VPKILKKNEENVFYTYVLYSLLYSMLCIKSTTNRTEWSLDIASHVHQTRLIRASDSRSRGRGFNSCGRGNQFTYICLRHRGV